MKELLEEVINMEDLTEDEYILARKDSFGASDAAALIGISPFTSAEAMIALKKIKEVTPEEREIGTKPSVRKGKDLEPLILQKTIEATGFKLSKPSYMYRLKDYPMLTVNYDSIKEDTEEPVEIKYVTIYGHKYFNLEPTPLEELTGRYDKDIREHIRIVAEKIGIPIYYYTQIQQQLLGTNASHGYLSCLFEKTWDLIIYKVPRDVYTQSFIVKEAERQGRFICP